MALLTDLRGKLKDYWKDKYDERTGDGTRTIWKLSKSPVTSQVITVATSTLTEDNEYSIDKDTGIVTFLSGAPGDNTGWTATYKFATFSDDQLYTFLNNGVKAISNDLFNDTYTDIGGNAIRHIETCESTAGWTSTDDATTMVEDSTDYKTGLKSLGLGVQLSSPTATYDQTWRSLLADPGFETRTSWATSVKAEYSTESAHTGTYSVKVYGQGTGSTYYGVTSENITVEPNKRYLYSMWVATGDTVSGTPHAKALLYQSASGAYCSETSDTFLLCTQASTFAYTNFLSSFVTPDDCYSVRMQLYGAQNVGVASSSAFTYFDDVTVREDPTWAMYYRKIPSVNISGYNYLNSWIKIDSTDHLDDRSAVEVRFGNNSANYYMYQWTTDLLKQNDWSHISCAFSDMSAVGTVSDSSMAYLEYRVYEDTQDPLAIAAGAINLDDIRISKFPIESTNQYEYVLPSRWDHVNRMEAWDDSGYKAKVINFETFGDKLRVDEKFGDGTYYKLFGSQDFATLYSSGSYATDMPREYEEMTVNHAAAEALESLLVDRTRYQAYSTYVANQGASVGSIQNAALYYRKLFKDDLERHGNMSHATEISPTLES